MTKFLFELVILCGFLFTAAAWAQEPCSGKSRNHIEVDSKTGEFFLCNDGHVEKKYWVSIGRGGADKKTKGDHRTPLGKYRLDTPRDSDRFYKFIPILYPTKKQIREGYTGGDIGIHGPDKHFSWLYKLNTWVNWTNGCIALSSEKEVSEIIDWIDQNNALFIEIF